MRDYLHVHKGSVRGIRFQHDGALGRRAFRNVLECARVAKILIADDDRLIGSMVSFKLENNGHNVLQAHDGEEARSVAAAELPDVILLDIMMPVVDGSHVLQQLKSHPTLQKIPVIMLTALGSEKDVVGCLKAGAADFVVKPFNLNELVARIEAVLRKR